MRATLLLVLPVFLFACDKTPAPATPPQAVSAAPAPASGVAGIILEKLDVSGYSYLKLQTGSAEEWAAVPTTSRAVGDTVTISNPMAMKSFESKTLGRTFDTIWFGRVQGEEGGAPGAGGMGGMGGMGGTAAMPAMPPTTPSAAPTAAPTGDGGSRTVASVWADKATLANQSVTVKGQVAKFNGGILNRNWVHVRDGSGTDAAKDNDLTFTTTDTVAVGDTVTATGTVRTNKDFGAGYTYAVIVEDAKVTK